MQGNDDPGGTGIVPGQAIAAAVTGPGNDTWVVVPVKRFDRAKTRLADTLLPQERDQLARSMLKDVLAAIAGSGLSGTLIVTDDRDAHAIAATYGARVLQSSVNSGPAEAVNQGARLLACEGHASMLGIMADLPLITANDIDLLLASHEVSHGITLVPARDGRGTNAAVCTPPDLLPLSFGKDSLSSHLASSRRLGIAARIVTLEGIALDVDQRQDLVAFLERESDGNTARYLETSGLAKRLLSDPDSRGPGLAMTRRCPTPCGDLQPTFRANGTLP